MTAYVRSDLSVDQHAVIDQWHATRVSVAPTDPDSALSSLAEVAERNGSAVAMIRHAADSAHYSTASWPGMGEWLTGHVPAIRTLADDLAAWCDRMES